MSRQFSPKTATASEPEASLDAEARSGNRRERMGNAATQERLGLGSGLGQPSKGKLPYKAKLESAFGQDLSDIPVCIGAAGELDGLQARAAYRGGELLLPPDATLEEVAHEVAHALQAKKHGEGSAGVSKGEEPAEKEAEEVAKRVAGGQKAGVHARPQNRVHRLAEDTPYSKVTDVPKQKMSKKDGFSIDSSATTTVAVGTGVTYTAKPTQDSIIATGSSYRYEWNVLRPGQSEPLATSTGRVLSHSWGEPGRYTVRLRVFLDGKDGTSTRITRLVFHQKVNADGRTAIHKGIEEKAAKTEVEEGVDEWSFENWVEYGSLIVTGQEEKKYDYIHSFKKQWVAAYRDVILKAAKAYSLPPLLVGGLVYAEVGGDPLFFDDAKNVIADADKISFGNVSIQTRRAAEAMGYEPEKLSAAQEEMILDSVKEPKQNIFIASRHIADLRDIDFPGKGADEWTADEIRVTATRYNRGPDLTRAEIEEDLDHGNDLISHAVTVLDALGLLSDFAVA